MELQVKISKRKMPVIHMLVNPQVLIAKAATNVALEPQHLSILVSMIMLHTSTVLDLTRLKTWCTQEALVITNFVHLIGTQDKLFVKLVT